LKFFKKKNIKKKNIILNFGPQHPAAHGVLRLILQLNSEIIQRMDIHIGLLHRGTENLITTKHYIKSIPYFDRLDYVSMMTQEHAYCLAIEKLLGYTNLSLPINLIRILFDEITRILNHMLAIACHALDIGNMSAIFWAFEEREKLMEFYERISGARMHAAYHKPINVFNSYLDKNLLSDILYFVKDCFITLNEMHNVLTYNKIWKQRLINIGVLSYEDCKNYSLTGVMSRSVGIKRDLRLLNANSYSGYNNISLKSYCGHNGDSYDRYLIRMLEMGESLNIINFVSTKLIKKYFYQNNFQYSPLVFNKIFYSTKKNSYTSMEDLIEHFVMWHTGFSVKKNTAISYIESPKGEFGVILTSNNTNKPLRCKIRSPSYFNLQALPKISKGHYLGDLAALIGTIDIVFGEVDR
jgi:NADH:ubiquinone oxidoreductase subunit D